MREFTHHALRITSAPFHLFPRGFKDTAFLRGQALQAMGGDFVEDGIDFTADEIALGRVLCLYFLALPRGGFRVADIDELAGPGAWFEAGAESESAEERRGAGKPTAPAHVGDAADETAEVRAVGDARVVAGEQVSDGDGDGGDQKIFGADGQHEEQEQGGTRVEQGKRADPPADAGRSADGSAAEVGREFEGEPGLEESAEDAADEEEGQKGLL